MIHRYLAMLGSFCFFVLHRMAIYIWISGAGQQPPYCHYGTGEEPLRYYLKVGWDENGFYKQLSSKTCYLKLQMVKVRDGHHCRDRTEPLCHF